MRRLSAALAVVLVSFAARAGQTYSFEPGQTIVSVEVGPRSSRAAAVTRTLAGRLVEQEGGAWRAELSLPLAPFTTGSRSRDQQLLAALASATFPEISFEGAAGPAQDGMARFEGTVRVRGVERPLAVPVTLVRAGGLLYGHASFVVHLREFGVPVADGASDEARVELDAGLRPERAGLATRG